MLKRWGSVAQLRQNTFPENARKTNHVTGLKGSGTMAWSRAKFINALTSYVDRRDYCLFNIMYFRTKRRRWSMLYVPRVCAEVVWSNSIILNDISTLSDLLDHNCIFTSCYCSHFRLRHFISAVLWRAPTYACRLSF